MIIFRKKISLRNALFPILVTALVLESGILPANEVAVIKVQYHRAEELLPIIRSLLSDKGSVTVSQRVNSLVVADNPEAIRRVYAFLERFDKPIEQVRIYVRLHRIGAEEDSAVKTQGRYSNDDVNVAVGRKKKDGVDIFIEDRRYRQQSDSTAFVAAMSGSPAFIRTGKEIPYRQGSDFFRRHAPGGETVIWQKAESGFEVTATVVGDNVHLAIVPRIAYDSRKDAVIHFFEARTELTVPFGQWVEIGGGADQQNEIIREILSRGMDSENRANSMSIMVQRP